MGIQKYSFSFPQYNFLWPIALAFSSTCRAHNILVKGIIPITIPATFFLKLPSHSLPTCVQY